MWAYLQKRIFFLVCPGSLSDSLRLCGVLLIAILACSPLADANAAQESVLPRASQDQLDALASRVAEQIRRSKIDPESTKFLAFDFSNTPDKQCSKLGAILADRFSAVLANHADGSVVLGRELLIAYFKDNWIDQRDIQGEGIALAIARSMGATGVLRGDLEEEPDNQLLLTLRLEGFGPAWSAGVVITATAEMKALSKDPSPAFSFTAPFPVEPGVLTPGSDGVGIPECIYCPPPLFNDLARANKYQGTIELSVVVTSEGRSGSIRVLKGAPFLLNKQAMDAVQNWKFKPAHKNGKPVSARVPVEITFRTN
jgi:TonB family protein